MSFIRSWSMLTLVAGSVFLVGYVPVHAALDSATALQNTCATITRVSLSPLRAAVGEELDVSVAATDADGDPIEYEWTSSSGSFADPTAQQTTYRCEEAGGHTIAITVSDSESCAAARSARVTCVQ